MKRFILPIAAVLALSACNNTANTNSASNTAANDVATTVGNTADQVVTGAAASYTAASKAGEIAVQSGKLDKATFKDLDNKAYAALNALKAAADTTNSADEVTAAANAASTVAAVYAAVAAAKQ